MPCIMYQTPLHLRVKAIFQVLCKNVKPEDFWICSKYPAAIILKVLICFLKISSDKAGYFPKWDVHFILLKLLLETLGALNK